MSQNLQAGFASSDITPDKSMFLFGYPHVERYSTGIHDSLTASCITLQNSATTIALCTTDLIFMPKYITREVRSRVAKETNIPPQHIHLAATHTHSGPMTEYMVSNINDPVVPDVDNEYIATLISKLTEVIKTAYENTVPCELAITEADGTSVGGNRRDPSGPSDPQVPVLVLRDETEKQLRALLTVYCMHPTVLHEDNTLYSADFPGKAREYLLKTFPTLTSYLYFTGPEGNQSPRHFIADTTFAEAERLGFTLGERIADGVRHLDEDAFNNNPHLNMESRTVDLPRRELPDVEAAEKKRNEAAAKLKRLKDEEAPYGAVRTAECDWFGAEETLALAQLAESGRLEKAYDAYLPAEITAVRVGNVCLVTLPGELYVEYSLQIKERSPVPTYVTCLTNGTTGGYIVTREGMQEGGYEAANALFDPQAGDVLVQTATELVKSLFQDKANP